MATRSAHQTYERRIKSLKRRRDFLSQRITLANDDRTSYDKAEAVALDWAIGVLENNYETAVEAIAKSREEEDENEENEHSEYNA